jgi:RNA polymerase sigma-70 factor (ECF subfamily)
MNGEAIVTSIVKVFTGLAVRETSKAMADSRSDEAIIDLVTSGNTEAFGILVKRYDDFVFTLARGIVLSDDLAKDITQEVFLRAYRAIRRFEKKSSFKTWLYRIAYNCSMSHLKNMDNKVESLDDQKTEIGADNPGLHPAKFAIRKLIDKLKPELKAVIIFHYYDDLKYEEIAEILGCPIGTVKIRLFRAKHELKELWEKHAVYMS